MNKYQQHQNLLLKIIVGVQKAFPTARLYQAHVGLFYNRRGTPVKIGHNGQADLNGFVSINGVAVRLEIEVKSGKSKIKKCSDQDRFRSICQKFGVIHIEANSVEQCVEELSQHVKNLTSKIETLAN